MQRLVGCATVLLGLANGFNLSPRHATVIEDPQRQPDSYFGYTVNLIAGKSTGSNAWVIVGAPKANSTAHVGLLEPGVVYQCNLAERWKCSPIILDRSGNVYHPSTSGGAYKHKKENGWLGAAVDVREDSKGGRIVACAPRWINQRHNQFYLMNGICYLKYFPFDSTEDATAFLPLIQSSKQISVVQNTTTNTKDELFIYAYGEAGVSVHFTEDNEMLIGAPGVRLWTGTAIRYKNYDLIDQDEFGGRNKRQHLSIPNPAKTSKLSQFGYFGYSVDSGRFLSSQNKTHYVAGAPREGYLKGKVFVFDFPKTDEQEYDVLVEREGSQIGEYFGSCVCAVDLTGDGLDDLVVGAPQHSLSVHGKARLTGDEGRVYVFVNEDGGIFREIGDTSLIMGSQEPGARFGTAIAKIGDINKDGFQDIAVGAPFEDSGRGAIYIYNGRSSGIHLKPSQRISAGEIHTSLAGFGMSISRGADLDGNHYNDVAVGAFSSGHAVIIPSQPVITFNAHIDSHVTRINLNAKSFTVAACISYTGQHAPDTVNVHITLSSESRAQFVLGSGDGKSSNTHSYHTNLTNRLEMCDDFRVKIQGPNPDFRKPIELQMHFILESQAMPVLRKRRDAILEPLDFCKTCAVVDPNQKSFITTKIPFAIECGEDNICDTDLSVTASFVNITQPFVLGSQPKLRVLVLVSNLGEQAFLVKLNASLPPETPLSRLPTLCQEVFHPAGTRLECDMTNSLEPNGTIELELDVDVDRVILPTVDALLEFGFNVSSGGKEMAYRDNMYTVALPVRTVADVTIQGKSNQDKGILAKGNQTFYHRFEVKNNGPSPLNILGLEFKIPVSLKSRTGDITQFIRVYEPTAYFDKQPFQCTTNIGKFATDVVETGVTIVLDDANTDKMAYTQRRAIRDTGTEGVTIVLDDANTDKMAYTQRRAIRDTGTETELPANRTLFVSCLDPDTACLSVQCNSSGPFLSQKNVAVVNFQLVAHFEEIKPLLGKKDIISISSVGRVWIINLPNDVQPLDGMPDVVTVNSVFFGNLPEQAVGSWVLPVSIIGGVLILLLIIAVLLKVGFFRRQKNDDLQSLHNEDTKETESIGVENTYAL